MLKTFVRATIVLWLGGLFSAPILWESQVLAEGKNSRQEFSFTIGLAEKKCQLAIWLTDEKGVFVDTVCVTEKVAKKGLGNRGGGLDDFWGGSRLSVLPVWAHQKGVDYGGGNFYPSEKRPLPDTITSATPKAGEFVWVWRPNKPLKPGKYFFYVEVNRSFDKNKHHRYSWYRGQPSVVRRGELEVGDQISESKAKIVGHGHVAGAGGNINPDVSTLTTALKLINKVEAVYRPRKN